MTQAEISFPKNAHHGLHSIEAESPWFRYRSEVICNAFTRHNASRSVIEVGAGTGVVAQALEDTGNYDVHAIEPLADGAAICRDRKISKVSEGTLESLHLPSESEDVIGLFDVLEHIEDPKPLLLEARRVLKSKGLFFITVPAHQWLWSSVDFGSGHFRRYSKATLVKDFNNNGFRTLETRYFMNLLTPPVFLMRVLPEMIFGTKDFAMLRKNTQNLLQGESTAGKIMALFLEIERKLPLLNRLPFGGSLLGVFRKE